MATLQIVSVRDAATGMYLRPWYPVSVGQARRIFGDECVKPEAAFAQHPKDFELFHLGEFIEETAQFVLFPAPVSLSRATEYVKG